MICKYLEKKLKLVPENVNDEFGGAVELEYYLLETEGNDETEELNGKRIYGIEIVKKVDESKVENAIIRDFSPCRENTELVVGRLARNTVTPITLPYILEDLLGA